MSQTKRRKKHPARTAINIQRKPKRGKTRQVRILMTLFFGFAGLAVGYLLSATNTGMIIGLLAGMAGGLLMARALGRIK